MGVPRTLVRVVAVPTASGTRSLVMLHPAVANRYERLVAAVAGDIERGLSDRVVANRVAEIGSEPPTLTLRPWRDERRSYARMLRTLRAPRGSLLIADVRTCYATIRPRVVAERLRTLGVEGGRDRMLEAFLEWTRSRLGIEGLPVGPAPSAVLANAVLGVVDDALIDEGRSFVRWVDDITVAVASEGDAGAALATIDAALGSVGLRRNAAKTRILDRADATLAGRSPTVRSAADPRVPLG